MHLLDLRGVAEQDAGLLGDARVDLDGAREGFVGDALHLLDEMFGVQQNALALHAARKHEHLPDDVRAAPRTGFQRLETGSHALVLGVVLDKLHGHHDRGEHVVQIVRQAAGEGADAFEPLAAEQLRFQLFFLRDVGVDDEDGLGLAVRFPHQRPAALNGRVRGRRGISGLISPVHSSCCWTAVQRAGGFKRIVVGHQFVGGAADGLGGRPAVKPVRALVPINDAVGEIAHENGVAGDVQQRGLRTDLLVGADVFGDVLQAHQHADRIAATGCVRWKPAAPRPPAGRCGRGF